MKKGNRAYQGLKEQKLLLAILLIGVAILVVPYLARVIGGDTALVGEQSYLHARMAEYAVQGISQDDLIDGGRTFYYTPYHYVLGLLGKLLGIEKASMVLPAVLGVLSLFFAYLLLKRLGVDGKTRFLILLPLVLSPAFIYTYTVSNPHAFAIMLTLLGFLCFADEERYIRILGAITFCLAAFSQPFNAALIIGLLLIYTITTKMRKNEAIIIIAILVLIVAIHHPSSFVTRYETMSGNFMQEIISDLGGKIGFGIFYGILTIIGFFASWKQKSLHVGVYIAGAALLASYPFLGNAASMYLNFFAAYFVGIGLVRLQSTRWEFIVIRNLTFLIIICGLLFSSISYLDRLSHAPVTKGMEGGLDWLAEHSLGDETVLSHPSYGYAIEYLAGRKVMLDSLFSSIPDAERRRLDMDTLFYTVNLEEAESILDRYGIEYILIDKAMKEQLVWEEPDQGLLYLLQSSETFKNAYANDEVEIWKVS